MEYRGDGSLGYPVQVSGLDFELDPHYQAKAPQPSDGYWKIGITTSHLDDFVAQIRARGVTVSEPRQFLKIGYLCHLRDPEGNSIELLSHSFEENRPARGSCSDETFGARLAHVTLRMSQPEPTLQFYQHELGLKLLSIQPVEEYGFTLYFLADTSDVPPCQDLTSVENREWLWRRPYTVLELQCLNGREVQPAASAQSSYRCLSFGGGERSIVDPSGHSLRI